jgi:signal transduction histidine kinase
MDMMGGAGSGMMTGTTSSSVRSAFVSALNTALLVGVLASVAAAALVAAFVTRRLLGPLDAVRAATRQIAAGRYEASVPVPSEPELAELATDVNALATALADTETRRTRLLGEVAHEMRTPLTALDGYVEGMIDGVFAADADTLPRSAPNCAGCTGWPTTCPACPAPRSNASTCAWSTPTWPS